MHHVLAAAQQHSSGASPVVWIVLVGGAVLVLWFFGWRPRHAKPMKEAAAGATVRAIRRGARRTSQHGKTPAPQPEDAS